MFSYLSMKGFHHKMFFIFHKKKLLLNTWPSWNMFPIPRCRTSPPPPSDLACSYIQIQNFLRILESRSSRFLYVLCACSPTSSSSCSSRSPSSAPWSSSSKPARFEAFKTFRINLLVVLLPGHHRHCPRGIHKHLPAKKNGPIFLGIIFVRYFSVLSFDLQIIGIPIFACFCADFFLFWFLPVNLPLYLIKSLISSASRLPPNFHLQFCQHFIWDKSDW